MSQNNQEADFNVHRLMTANQHPYYLPQPSMGSSVMTSVPMYIDFSGVPCSISSFCPEEAGRKSYEQFFPVKLHTMLTDLEKEGRSDIVSWSPHGRAFVVKRQDAFVAEIIPKWFRQTGYASFRRQLNLYGFNRITSGRDKGAYYHQLFLRGKCFLADRMERVKLAGPVTKGRKRNAPELEPNFYLMPPLPLAGDKGAANQNGYSSQTVTNSSSAANNNPLSNGLLPQVPHLTPLNVLQQHYNMQTSFGGTDSLGMLSASLVPHSQLNTDQLGQLVNPLLLPHAASQQLQLPNNDLETQMIQEQIKILRARLVSQILSTGRT